MTSRKQFLYIILLTLLWSPSFLFIKLAVTELPPLLVVSLRVTLATLIMVGILIYNKVSLPRHPKFWLYSTVMAFFASALPFSLFCYAETVIDSALAAILNGTTPMFTALLAHRFVASDRLTYQKAVGVLLSSFGVILLFAPKIEAGLSATSLGMIAALVAAFSYAISHIYGKLYVTKQAPYVAPTAQFVLTGAMLWPFAIFSNDCLSLSCPSIYAWIGVVGLALFGTVIAFIIYYKLLDHCGPTAISMAACFFPVIGMLFGFLFLGESLSLISLVGASFILLGMLTVNRLLHLPFLKQSAQS